MTPSRDARPPTRRPWFASMVLIVALVAYAGLTLVRLRSAVIRTTPAPRPSATSK